MGITEARQWNWNWIFFGSMGHTRTISVIAQIFIGFIFALYLYNFYLDVYMRRSVSIDGIPCFTYQRRSDGLWKFKQCIIGIFSLIESKCRASWNVGKFANGRSPCHGLRTRKGHGSYYVFSYRILFDCCEMISEAKTKCRSSVKVVSASCLWAPQILWN